MINYSALVLGILFFEMVKYGLIMPAWLGLTLMGILFVVLVLSFVQTYVRTGMWSLAHRGIDRLDERELLVVTQAVRISYSIFTVMVIVVVYLFALLGAGPFDVVIAGTLLYLAHILPVSILAWTEKEV